MASPSSKRVMPMTPSPTITCTTFAAPPTARAPSIHRPAFCCPCLRHPCSTSPSHHGPPRSQSPPPPVPPVSTSFHPATRNGTRPAPVPQDTASSTSDRRNDGLYEGSLSDDLDPPPVNDNSAEDSPAVAYLPVNAPHHQSPQTTERPSVGIFRMPKTVDKVPRPSTSMAVAVPHSLQSRGS